MDKFNPGEKMAAQFWIDEKIHEIVNNTEEKFGKEEVEKFLE